MHDRRIGVAENRPHLDDSARQSDQLAMLFAAGLDRRADLDPAPGAPREDRLLEVDGRGAESPAILQNRIPCSRSIKKPAPRRFVAARALNYPILGAVKI